ncbi:MAG: hypothetical protein J6C79_04340 [Clostridia bacterium]|nr:hypothetical protein [Clostridia bacterium]
MRTENFGRKKLTWRKNAKTAKKIVKNANENGGEFGKKSHFSFIKENKAHF